MSTVRRKKIVSVFAVAILAMTILFGMFLAYADNDTAFAYSYIPSGTIENLYSESSGKFILNNLDSLAAKAGYVDLDAMIAAVKSGTVIKASGTGGFAENTTVALGSFTAANGTKQDLIWVPTYVSKNSAGKATLTLWLARTNNYNGANGSYAQETAPFSDGTYPSSHTTTQKYNGRDVYANTYDSSYIRNYILNGSANYVGSWGNGTAVAKPSADTLTKFDMLTKGALSNFVITPSQMPWQMGEYEYKNDPANGYASNFPNAWTNDKIWLPSMNEVFSTKGVATGNPTFNGGIWNTTQYNIVANSTHTITRSGNSQYNHCYYMIYADGSPSKYADNVFGSFSVRPAVHIDLDMVSDAALMLKDVDDESITYTSSQVTLSSLDKLPDWYDATRMDITYDSGMTDAGEYTCTATIKPSLVSKGVTFDGTPDTSIGESSTVRKFKFTIEKKKIGATLSLDSVTGLPKAAYVSGEVYSGDIGTSGEPQFGFTYSGRPGTGTSYSSDVAPTAVGKYVATPKVINNCNYEIDTTKNLSIDFDINKKDVKKPSISGASSYEYDGSDKTFTLSNVTGDVKITAKRDDSTPTTQSDGGITVNTDGTLTAKRAGKYVITVMLADNGASTQWEGGTSVAAYDMTVEIKKKTLTVTVTHDSWSWETGADESKRQIKVVGNCVTGDRTELYMYALKSGTTNEIDLNAYREWDETDNRIRTVTVPELAQGTYTFNVRLFGDHYNNDNYEMTAISMTFTVGGKKVSFTSADAKWTANGEAVTDSQLKLTYTGSAFNVLFDTSDLASKGVMIDATKGTSGYTGSTTETNVGTYSVTVYLKELSGDYESWTGSYTLSYSIERAKYDLSGLSWNYTSALSYNNKNQSVTLTGNIPTGLTVNYSDNTKKLVGTYKASVSFTNSNNNYITPTPDNTDSYSGSFAWELNWEITKAKLKAQWKRSSTSGSAFTPPKLLPDGELSLHEMVEYTWYDAEGNEIAESDVKHDGHSETKYKVKATLQSVYAASYELEFNAGEDPFEFTVGVNMYPVRIEIRIDGELLKATYPYRGSAYIAVPKVTLSEEMILPSDITVKYKKIENGKTDEGTTTAPSTVGKYKVLVSVNSETSYIHGDCDEFEFEIVKADFDTSSLRWEYTHGDVSATYDFVHGKWVDANNAEIHMSYDKTAHTVKLVNKDKIPGLNITTEDTEHTEAGEHSARITYTYDTSCYNEPAFPTSVNINIEKADIDVSNLRWGYTKSGSAEEYAYTESFTYTRVGGVAIEFNVKLIGIPGELKGAISYVVDSTYVRAASKAGAYKTKFVFDVTNFDSSNYNIPEIFDNTAKEETSKAVLPDTLEWEIGKRYVTTPVYDGSFKTFDDKTHSLTDICGLEENWEEYVEITVTKDGKPYDGYKDNAYDIYDAGDYVISFKLMILDATPNIAWTSRTENIKIFVGEYKLRVESWTGEGLDAETEPSIKGLPSFFEYVYTTPEGEEVTVGDILSTYNTAFLKTLRVKEAYRDNAVLEGETSFRFVSDIDPTDPPEMVERPYFENRKITYDGAFHTLEEFSLQGYNEEYMTMNVELDRVKDIGTYTVTVEFVRGANYSWTTEDGSIDKTPLTLEYEITLRKITKPSGEIKLEYNGEIQICIPEGLDSNWVTLSGNEAKDKGIYTATAELYDTANTTWEDGTTDSVTFTFEIVTRMLERPKAPEDITYNGKEIDILEKLGIDISLFETSGDTVKKDAGEYTFTLTLKDNDNYAFKSEESEVSLAEEGEGSIAVTWRIQKAKLKPTWNASGAIPSFSIPGEYEGLVEIEHEYIDKDGNTVKLEELVSGESYKVVAKLKEGYENNFEFTDSEGNVLETPAMSEEKPFEINNGTTPPSEDTKPNAVTNIPEWLVPIAIVALCFIVATFLLVIGLFIGMMILIAMKKNENNAPYPPYPPYPPYASQYESEDDDDDEYEDDDEEEEDNAATVNNDAADYAQEIAAANTESVRYVPEGAVVIAEGQLANKDEAKRLEDDGSFYAFEKRDGETLRSVADGAIVINGSERPDIKDAILLLSDDQKRYIFGLRDYAIEKSGDKASFAKYHLTVGKGAKQVIKLSVKDGKVMAYFRIEDERLRAIRRNARENDAEIKIKETEIEIDGESAYEMAKDLIDLRKTQIDENIAYQKQQRREKRKAKREQSNNAEREYGDT